MEYLFTPENLKMLQTFLTKDAVFGFDFDGTLAPLVNNRDMARMTPETEKLLENFTKLARVVIITGRGKKDIEYLMNVKPHYLIGNHGSEGLLGEEEAMKIINSNSSIQAHLMNTYNAQLSKHGIEIEDKKYSLSLHYRRSRDVQETEKFLSQIIKDLDAVIIPGKFVLNILPPGTLNKGDAFASVMHKEKVSSGFYIGDDVTDEDVFSIKDQKVLTVRVGKSDTSQASYFINDQSEINTLLEHLCKRTAQ